MKRRQKSKVESTEIELGGYSVPLKIYRERRRSLRASIGKDSFILRMPSWLSEKEEMEGVQWFRRWAERKIRENEGLAAQFQYTAYADGDCLQVGSRHYTLRIRYEDRKTHSAKLQNGEIRLRLSRADEGLSLQKNVRHLLSRVVAGDFLPEITRRVHALNEKYFRKRIRAVRLKYNHSNWGSCSTNGNINLSTRLLFAPDEVIDYVIVHELAHLIEMNHSRRFWQLVAEAVPDYREKEKWLKENRHRCDF